MVALPVIPGVEWPRPAPSTAYRPEVERWRSLVEHEFKTRGLPDADVDKALYVIDGESGGDPLAANPTSSARGLVQMTDVHGIPEETRYDPVASVKWMADQVADHGWTDWGEGVTYEGKPFGILGLKPYGGGAPESPGIGITFAPGRTLSGLEPIGRPGYLYDTREPGDNNTGLDYGPATQEASDTTEALRRFRNMNNGLEALTSDLPYKGLIRDMTQRTGQVFTPLGSLDLLRAGVNEATGLDLPQPSDVWADIAAPQTYLDAALSVPLEPLRAVTGLTRAAGETRAAGGLLGIVDPAERAAKARQMYDMLKAAGQSDADIAAAFGEDAVKFGKTGVDVAGEALDEARGLQRVADEQKYFKGKNVDRASTRAKQMAERMSGGVVKGMVADAQPRGAILDAAGNLDVGATLADEAARIDAEGLRNAGGGDALTTAVGVAQKLGNPTGTVRDLVFGANGEGNAAVARQQTEERPTRLQSAANEIGAAISAPVSLKSNLSPPLFRQGLARVVTRPRQGIQEFAKSLKAFKNEAAERIHAEYADDVWIRKSGEGAARGQAALTAPGDEALGNAGYTFEDVGGTILDWRSGDANIKPEDLAGFIPDTKVGKITESMTRAFNRQAAVEINLHRTGWYKEVAAQMWKSGDRDVKHYEDLRKTVEQFTHRGSWAQPNVRVGGIQLPTFFSTRAMSGRLQAAWRGMAALGHPQDLTTPGPQQEAARAFLSLLGVNVAMVGGAYAAADAMGLNPSVEMDGKLPILKVGNTRWDPWAGFNAPARFAMGVITDTVDATRDEGIQNAPQGAIASLNTRGQKFLRGGFAPVVGKVADTATGRDFTGEKYNLWQDVVSGGFAKDMTAPFIAETLLEAAQLDGPLAAAVVAGPAALSTGISTYQTDADQADATARSLFDKNWDDLDTLQKIRALQEVPEEAQRKTRQTFRATYNEARTAAGYDHPSANTAALDRQNPEIDAQGWALDHGPVYSKEAADLLLQSGAEGREIRLAGTKRAVNQDENSRKAWDATKKLVDVYLHELVPAAAPAIIAELGQKDKTYLDGGKPKDFAKLTREQRGTVTGRVHEAARKDAQVDAALVYWGIVEKPQKGHEQAVIDFFTRYKAKPHETLTKGVVEGIKAAGR